MKKEFMRIENIPVILWEAKAESIFIHVHGKNANKEESHRFADKAVPSGFQVLSFDLPEGVRYISLRRDVHSGYS